MYPSTREKILTTTIPLLAVHGYTGTSMRDVAVAVGIQPSVIYHYFPDKETLFQAVRMKLNEELLMGVPELLKSLSVMSVLREYVLFRIHHREAIVALRQFFSIVKLALPPNPREGYIPERALEEICAIMKQGEEEGHFQVNNPRFTANAINGLIDNFLVEHYPHELSSKDEEALADKLLRLIKKILRPEDDDAGPLVAISAKVPQNS